MTSSCLPPSRAAALSDQLDGAWDQWNLAIAAHITAAVIALVFPGVTRTWIAGLMVLLPVSTSLSITLLLRNRIAAADRRHRPDRG